MKQPRRSRSQPPDTEMSLEQLDAWLGTVKPAPRVSSVSMLDGYLTALVIGPCSIEPDEWFSDLLGARGRIATASGKSLAVIMSIVGRFNAISNGLSLTPEQHAPIFEKTDDGTVLAGPWCMGFLAGMQLRFAEWQPLLDLNHIEHGLMLPILLHCTDAFGRPMLGPPREGPETEEFLRQAYHDIPIMLPEIRGFWMPRRFTRSESQG